VSPEASVTAFLALCLGFVDGSSTEFGMDALMLTLLSAFFLGIFPSLWMKAFIHPPAFSPSIYILQQTEFV
jgi:hypothetical protein